MKKISLLVVCLLAGTFCFAAADSPKILRWPTLSRTQIAFTYANDLWIVGRDGGDAGRLTTGLGLETRPIFSPDGSLIAFSGEYEGNRDVYVVPAAGGIPRRLTYHPDADEALGWTPDGKRILFRSARNSHVRWLDQLYTMPVEVGGFPSELPLPMGEQASFSPDGTHLAYVPHPQWQAARKRYRGGQTTPIWIVNLATSKVEAKIPRENSNDFNPMWVGNNIYFLSDRNGPVSLFAYDTTKDMSSIHRPVSRTVYLTVLGRDDPSPLSPESDEEKNAEDQKNDQKHPEPNPKKPLGAGSDESSTKYFSAASDQGHNSAQIKDSDKAGTGAENKDKDKNKAEDKEKDKSAKEEPVVVRVDPANIGQRILALPVPARNYVHIEIGKTGELFLAEAPAVVQDADSDNPKFILHKFDLKKRKVDKFLDEVSFFTLSHNGEKLLYRKADDWIMAATDEPPKPGGEPKPGEGPLKLEELKVYVDPQKEWAQMYHEVWRIERDFFYDPHYHGLDLAATERKYAPYMANLGSRQELSYIFEEMLGELTVGHVFVNGGDSAEPKPLAKTGLLGADYNIENGRYRFATVYNGENWNPDLQAPLTQPGVNVHAGEYLLAVNGRELHAADNLYSFFQGTAGKSVVLKVGPNPDAKAAREVTVVPVDNEVSLRRLAWIESNRRKVDELSGGRVAYVYLPNTAEAGYNNFNRYYFSQVDKQAAVIDERFNEGGDIADYIVDYLGAPL